MDKTLHILNRSFNLLKRSIKADYDNKGYPKNLYDNHPVILGEQNLLFNKVKELSYIEKKKLWESLNKLMFIPNTNDEPNGILLRQPMDGIRERWEIEQHDNYLYTCYMSIFDKQFRIFARLFMKYGITHLFHYDQRTIKEKGIKEYIKGVRQPYQIAIIEMYSYPLLHLLKVIGVAIGMIFIPSNFKYLLSLLLITDIHLFLTILVEFFKPMSNTSGKMLLWGLFESRKAGIMSRFYGYFYHMLMKIKCKNYVEEIFSTYWHTYPKMIKLVKLVNKIKGFKNARY